MVCPRWAGGNTFFVHGGPRRTTEKTFAGDNLVCSWRTGREHLFCPRRATKDHGENLCKGIIWSVHGGRGGNTFFVHEGPRRATKDHGEHLCRGIIWSVHGGPGGNTFFVHGGPRRDGNLCRGIIWSVHGGRGGTPFLSTEGHGGPRGPRRTPLQGYNLVCARWDAENTFCGRLRLWSSITRVTRETVRFCPQAVPGERGNCGGEGELRGIVDGG